MAILSSLKPSRGLIARLAACALLVALPAAASIYDIPDPHKKEKEAAAKRQCRSTQEFVKAMRFLRQTKEFNFRENASREIAVKVSQGCDGAAERFAKILVLMKGIGLSERKSLEMGLKFAAYHPEVQKNFIEIFTRAFLAEFFDYEYSKAMDLAFELSKDYKGDPYYAREDFIDLVKLCKEPKKLDLPMHFCSQYAIKVARLSQYFPEGLKEPFRQLFEELRTRKELSLDVKTALELTYGILEHGPNAPVNFFEAYTLATKELDYDKREALEFGLTMASHSHTEEAPPILQFTYGGPMAQPQEDTASK